MVIQERFSGLPIQVYIWIVCMSNTVDVEIRFNDDTRPQGNVEIIGGEPISFTLYARAPGLLSVVRRYYGMPTGRDQVYREISRMVEEDGDELHQLIKVLTNVVKHGVQTALGYGDDSHEEVEGYLRNAANDPIFNNLGMLGAYRLWIILQNLYKAGVWHCGAPQSHRAAA